MGSAEPPEPPMAKDLQGALPPPQDFSHTPLPPAAPGAPVPKSEQAEGVFVSFRLGRDLFALPLDSVERALRMVAPVRLPEAPSWVAGVINMYGQMLPVLDLGQLFGQSPRHPHPDQRLLVVTQQPRKVALLVDTSEQVLKTAPGEMEPPSGHLASSRVLAGVLQDRDKLVLVLNPERLAPSEWHNREDLWEKLEEQATRLLAESDD